MELSTSRKIVNGYIVCLIVLGVAALILFAVVKFGDFHMVKGEGVKEEMVGSILNVSETPTSFMENRTTRIETDKGVFNIVGVISVMKGVDVSIENYESGKRYVCLSDRDICFRLVDER